MGRVDRSDAAGDRLALDLLKVDMASECEAQAQEAEVGGMLSI